MPMMPLSPSATCALLARLGHKPRRSLGQNFLVDGNIVRKSLELAQVAPGEAVVEVGPGLGTLTSALLDAGARVWAIEADPILAAHLGAELAPAHPESFRLMRGDAVEHPLAGLPAGQGSSFKIVANLPYAIATPWLDAVLAGPLPERMVLMLQREAAERYTAPPGDKAFGAITVFLQCAYRTGPGHPVAASCFHPRPNVESRLLNLIRRPDPYVFPRSARSLIRECFQQRRKQIGSVLRHRLPGAGERWLAELARAGFPPQTRAEAIPPELWKGLAPA